MNHLNKSFFIIGLFSILFTQSGHTENAPAGGGIINSTAYAQSRLDIIPHSPEAESLGKYGVLPVTLYSGTPQISIPLFEIKTPTISVPFALQYSYNGCKPNEMATSIGLGWTLSGTGVITRIIKGKFDEDMGSTGSFDSYGSLDPLYVDQSYLISVGISSADAEPDEFKFNIGKYSGDFIIMNGKAYISRCPNIKISPLKVNGSIVSFLLIDEEGNQYLFEDAEVTHGKNQPTHKSAWYISRIISANKQDTISFSYTGYTYKQPTTIYDSYSVSHSDCNPSQVDQGTLSTNASNGAFVDALLLQSVSCKYSSLNFELNTIRQDLVGSTDAKRLTSITMQATGSELVRKITLNQSYFTNNSRLKLNSVVLEDVNKSYFFNYEDTSFPEIASRAIDLYGYYNGENGNTNLFPLGCFSTSSILSPANRNANKQYGKIGILKSIIYPTGGFSEFTWEQNKIGHIPEPVVTKPTLAVVCEYNVNDSHNDITTNRANFTIGVGQKIKVTCSNYDEVYPTIPILQILSGSKPIYTSPLLIYPNDNNSDSIYLSPGTYSLMVQCQKGIWKVDGRIEYVVYTTDLSHITDGPGLRIQQIASYDNKNTKTPLFTDSYNYNDGQVNMSDAINSYGLETRGVGGSVYNTCYFASIRSALSDYDNEQFYYSKVTKTSKNAQITGKTDYEYIKSPYIQDIILHSEIDYKYENSQFSPVSSKVCDYKHILKNSWHTLKAAKTLMVGASTCPVTNSSWVSTLASPDLTQACSLTEIYSLTSQDVVNVGFTLLSQEKNTNYDGNGQNGIVSQTDYYYDNPNQTYPTQIVNQNSAGEQITTQFKYPLDYNWNAVKMPDEINEIYKNEIQTAINTFYTSRTKLLTELAPYQLYISCSAANKSTFSSIVSKYHYVNDFYNASNTAAIKRNTSITDFSTALNTGITSNSIQWQKAVLWMQLNNMTSPVIEKIVSIKKTNGDELLLSATRNEYLLSNDAVVLEKIQQTEINNRLLKSNFLSNQDNYYKLKFTNKYDSHLKLITQTGPENLPKNYLWGYNGLYPVAEIKGSDYSTISGLVNKEILNNISGTYTEQELLTELQKIRTGLNGTISLINTFTYDPFWGMLSKTDARGIRSHFGYNDFGQLSQISDNRENIVKEFIYHYYHVYYNTDQTQTFTKNNCEPCYSGSSVKYTVPANKYSSNNSQTDADQQAISEINSQGQSYANANGVCTNNCTGVDQKCINGVCQTGAKVYTDSRQDPGNYVGYFRCTYHYEWTDQSRSGDYTEIVKGGCAITIVVPF